MYFKVSSFIKKWVTQRRKIFSLSFKEGMRNKMGDLGEKKTIFQVTSKAFYKYYYIQQPF